MILNFDRGYGQSAEQMVQSLMESTQMAFDTLERKLGMSEGSPIYDDGNVIADKIEANNVIADKIEANNLSINGMDIRDSGWIDATLTSDFTVYDTATPKYRKVGNMVEVVGAVKSKSAIAGSTTQYPIFTLPEGYRPLNTAIVAICQGSGTNIWTLRINTNGVVSFERYRSGTSYVATSTSSWLPFHVMFFVD